VNSRFLIVTADDFGLHEAVNEAVRLASRAGTLTAASLMVGAPAAAQAVAIAHATPRLRVGLHVVLADGMAVSAPESIRALADAEGRMDGRMFRRGVRYFALPRVRRQLEAEIRAQFEAFTRTGLNLDHVNVHKHFHLHPSILALLLSIGREHGLQAMRVPDEPLWFAARSGWAARAGTALLRPWVGWMKRRLRRGTTTGSSALPRVVRWMRRNSWRCSAGFRPGSPKSICTPRWRDISYPPPCAATGIRPSSTHC
jgi:hopanoid biosynthesis associated protein HpnK